MDVPNIHSCGAAGALIMLEARQDVDGVPETDPSIEAAGPHVGGDQAGGGANYQTVAPAASFQTLPFE